MSNRGFPIPSNDDVTAGDAATGTAARRASSGLGAAFGPILQTGTTIGNRYFIEEILGVGGMGAVYKARDQQLDRTVALKVIRPDIAGEAAALQRFKQEVLLASQITHRNIVRLYDMGEAVGLKFITMEYVPGRDLRSLLIDRGKLPPVEAIGIMRQVCLGLQVAHEQGVIHRDLKPSNVMVDDQGRVVIMDFGLARTTQPSDSAMTALTHTGTVLGTMEYMSPEQARGEELDARSDLFAVGLIFYELLTGNMPYKAPTSVASLLKRTQEAAVPVAQVDPSIPKSLSAVVSRCLERELHQRYQSAVEILADLNAVEGRKSVQAAALMVPRSRRSWLFWAGSLVLAVVLAAVGTTLFLKTKGKPPTAGLKVVRVLVADFNNTTSEAVFDGTLEPAFSVSLEGASFVSAYSRRDARKAAAQLKPGATVLDEELARLVAAREGIDIVLAGAIAQEGGKYRITAKAVDSMTAHEVFSGSVDADSKEAVLPTVGKLASKIRKALGDTTPESALLAAGETYTAGSLQSAHDYGAAQELLWAGKWDQAIATYQKIIAADPDFGRAYAGMATTYANLGKSEDADRTFKLAMAKLDRMTEREKFRTRISYYLFTRNTEKALEELSELVKRYPADTAGVANLALVYYLHRDMNKAVEIGRKAVELSPKNVLQRNNLGLFLMHAGDFKLAIEEQKKVLELNKDFVLAHVGIALSQFADGQPEAALATYDALEKISAEGASAAAIGRADIALYQGKTADAIAVLKKSMAADLAAKNDAAAAHAAYALAQASLVSGRTAEAAAAADQAATLDHEPGTMFAAAQVYIAAGQDAKALAIARRLAAELGSEARSFAKLIEAEAELKHGKAQAALALAGDAKTLADTWLAHFQLGRSYLEAGAFTEAYAEFEACEKRRGEVISVFLDEIPTYRLLPPVYYYMGRAQEGLKSPAAAESYRNFLNLRKAGERDALVTDAERRLKALEPAR